MTLGTETWSYLQLKLKKDHIIEVVEICTGLPEGVTSVSCHMDKSRWGGVIVVEVDWSEGYAEPFGSLLELPEPLFTCLLRHHEHLMLPWLRKHDKRRVRDRIFHNKRSF